ncbi:ammonia-dependent NAD(+) synthetase [Bacillus mexicanus]|uniref:ammonia-dependent NAD(+) synthetase n=1 Tax=Bacillus mexicanus TaxID=2834415 RepID=UPI003D1DBB1B
MTTKQQQIIKELNVKPNIDPKLEIELRVDFLKSYLLTSKANGFVLGISGGQDSTLAGKLAQIAVYQLRNEGHDSTFTAVRLPYGTQKDEDDAQLALNFINPDVIKIFNVYNTVEALNKDYQTAIGTPLSDYHKGNVKARIRMVSQYAIGGMDGLLVIGTDHAAEAITGFFTKYGDGGADLLPLNGLSKRQGRLILKELNAPKQLYLKEPTADLLDEKPQQTDETELGITYDQIDDYLEGKNVPSNITKIIEERYNSTEHKRNPPATMFDKWWN